MADSSSAMSLTGPGLTINLDSETLRQIVQAVVRETLTEIGTDRRLAYGEAEAAELLGLRRHQLRDCRLRGEINASKCGKELRYLRSDLLEFLSSQKVK